MGSGVEGFCTSHFVLAKNYGTGYRGSSGVVLGLWRAVWGYRGCGGVRGWWGLSGVVGGCRGLSGAVGGCRGLSGAAGLSGVVGCCWGLKGLSEVVVGSGGRLSGGVGAPRGRWRLSVGYRYRWRACMPECLKPLRTPCVWHQSSETQLDFFFHTFWLWCSHLCSPIRPATSHPESVGAPPTCDNFPTPGMH